MAMVAGGLRAGPFVLIIKEEVESRVWQLPRKWFPR